jgi:hypothetical protein
MKGELVDRARAVAQVFKLARDERDAWVNWPARVAAMIAAHPLRGEEAPLLGHEQRPVADPGGVGDAQRLGLARACGGRGQPDGGER